MNKNKYYCPGTSNRETWHLWGLSCDYDLTKRTGKSSAWHMRCSEQFCIFAGCVISEMGGDICLTNSTHRKREGKHRGDRGKHHLSNLDR